MTHAFLLVPVIGNGCPWDLNGDCVVNVEDLLILLGQWGDCQGCSGDLNGDDVVNVLDLLAMLGAWGDCPGCAVGFFTLEEELGFAGLTETDWGNFMDVMTNGTGYQQTVYKFWMTEYLDPTQGGPIAAPGPDPYNGK